MKQNALYSQGIRFCWLRTRTDLGEQGRVTADKLVTTDHSTQSERSECEYKGIAIQVRPRSPIVGGRFRPPSVDYIAILAGEALTAPRFVLLYRIIFRLVNEKLIRMAIVQKKCEIHGSG